MRPPVITLRERNIMRKIKIPVSSIGFAVILGRECNLDCKYCVQKHMHKQQAPKKKRIEDIIRYLRDARSKSDENMILSFYGGEPLIYYDDMKRLSNELEGFDFLLTTNGLLLTKEKVDFLNETYFDVMVSYDGKQSKEVRGFDPVSDRRKELIAINDLSIHTVLKSGSSYAETLQKLEDFNAEYRSLHGYDIKISFAPIVPFSGESGYCASDYKRDLKQILSNAGDNLLARQYFNRLKNQLENAVNGCHPTNLLDKNCRYGTMIPISMDGDIYACLNRDHVVANIDDPIKFAMEKIAEVNMTERMKRCKECFFNGVTCKNAGCPIQSDDVFEQYCSEAKDRGTALLEVLDEISQKGL